MKPKHKLPKPKEAGLPSQSFFDLFKKKSHTAHSHDHKHEPTQAPEGPIHTIALVIDGQVYDVLRAQDALADLLLAQPTFVLVTEDTTSAKINFKYRDGKFIDE